MQLNRNWPTRIRYDGRPGWRATLSISALPSPSIPSPPLPFFLSIFHPPLSSSLSLYPYLSPSHSKRSVPWHTPARLCRIVPRCATRPRCVPHLSRFSLFPPTVTQFAAGIVSSAHASGSRLHRGASAPGFHTLLLLLFATQHLGYQHRCPSLSFSFSLHILTDHLSFIRYDVSLFFSLFPPLFLGYLECDKNVNCSSEIEYAEYEYAEERWDIAGAGYSRGSKSERVLEKRRRGGKSRVWFRRLKGKETG